MRPILFEWGSFVVPAWHAFYALGAIVAFFTLLAMASKYAPDLPEKFLGTLYFLSYVGGYFGARLFSIVFEDFAVKGIGETLAALFTFGAMTFYGGAVGAFVLGVIYTSAKRFSVGAVMDLCIPAALLALAIGRIGCFLNGDDYGLPVNLAPGESAPWWAVTFPSLRDEIPRYPVQLISAFAAASLGTFLIWRFRWFRRRYPAGIVGYVGIVLYAVGRFGIEYLRGDPRGAFFADLFSPAQVVSIVVLGIMLALAPLWVRTKVRS